jgi:cytochrome c5
MKRMPSFRRLACVLGAFAATAADGDRKRGRVYYQLVCTACHKERPTAASNRTDLQTKAEWAAYPG